MNERLKRLRKELGLTQQEFANKLRVPRNNIANYESTRRIPSEAVVSLICQIFNVSENWLRTGEGDMFISHSRDEQIAYYVGSLLSGESDGFKQRFISVLCRLTDKEWEWIEQKAREIVGENEEE